MATYRYILRVNKGKFILINAILKLAYTPF